MAELTQEELNGLSPRARKAHGQANEMIQEIVEVNPNAEPEEFEEDLRIYRDMCDSSNKASDKVNVVSRLNLDDEALSKEKLTKFEDMGIERLVCGLPYKDLDDFLNKIDFIKSLIN